LNTGEGIRAAFYDPNDAAGFSSLREYARQIDLLYPEWLHLLSQDGHIKAINDQVLPPSPTISSRTAPFIRSTIKSCPS
jgi:hypothetical protein